MKRDIVKSILLTAMWEVVRTHAAHETARAEYDAWKPVWQAKMKDREENDPDAHAQLVLRDEADMRSDELGKTARPMIEAEAKYRAIVDLVADLGFAEEDR